MNWVNTYLSRITQFVKSMQPQVGDYWLDYRFQIQISHYGSHYWLQKNENTKNIRYLTDRIDIHRVINTTKPQYL